MFRLLMAGGGTGGHLFPAVAVAEEFMLRRAEIEVLFVGTALAVRWKRKSSVHAAWPFVKSLPQDSWASPSRPVFFHWLKCLSV